MLFSNHSLREALRASAGTFEEAFSPEWVEKNITDQANELVVLRRIIPWEATVSLLAPFYDRTAGAAGRSLRIMTAILIISRLRGLSDRKVVEQVRENRYIQYFCNVPDRGLQTFLHPSSLCVFRKRIGEKGFAIIEQGRVAGRFQRNIRSRPENFSGKGR
ncbi:MAG: hypothetical protein B6245_09720, partial [Desulfobacteraceae bacterium 4572_88]